MPCKFYFRTTVNFVHLQNYESHLLSHVHSRKTHFRGTILRVNSVSVKGSILLCRTNFETFKIDYEVPLNIFVVNTYYLALTDLPRIIRSCWTISNMASDSTLSTPVKSLKEVNLEVPRSNKFSKLSTKI